MVTEFMKLIPVLPSLDILRDTNWYWEKTGFEVYYSDSKYAILYRENLVIHLQWHGNTPEDPFPGMSVTRIYVKNIMPLFEEFVKRGTVTSDIFKSNTSWKTNEFGFYDLNNNAIFIMEDTID